MKFTISIEMFLLIIFLIPSENRYNMCVMLIGRYTYYKIGKILCSWKYKKTPFKEVEEHGEQTHNC